MNEKDSLADKMFIAIFEKVTTELCEQRKQLAEQFGKSGLLVSGPHARAIIDLELSQLKKLLDSKLRIDLEVYFKGKQPHIMQDESFLIQDIEKLYEIRKSVSIRSLVTYFERRGFSNITSQLSRFGVDADKIFNEIKRNIEILILKNKLDVSSQSLAALPQMEIESIINKGEGQQIEFKSTLRWDIEKHCHNDSLHIEVLETICAFNNTDGGYILIGIRDNKSIFGLEMDYSTFGKQNPDTFIQTITNFIKNGVSNEFASKPEIVIEKYEGHDLCKIKVDIGFEPVWLKKNGKELFVIRTQVGEQKLSPREAADYIRKKWPIITR